MSFSTQNPQGHNPHTLFLFQQWLEHPITDSFIKNLESSIAAGQQQAVNGRRQLTQDQLVFLLEAVAARQELLKQIKSGNFRL